MSVFHLNTNLVEGTEGEFGGLTQTEAESRYVPGQDNSIVYRQGQSKRDIVQAAILSVYTFDLIGVAVVFWLLDQPISAIFSITIMVLLFSRSISQAFKAKDRLDSLLEQTSPEGSIIRNDKLRAIDPDEIVPGDLVVVGPGDQVFADGHLVSDDPISVNESWITGDLEPRPLQKGDVVLAGSYCLSGHGIYEVEAVGEDRQISAVLNTFGATQQPRTPLQALIYRVLAGLRFLVVVLGAYIIVRFMLFESDPAQRGIYESALSIILGLAPGGIYFMILLTYIGGSSQLAGSGALVQRETSVETLAQTDVLCFGKAGTLTGTLVDFEATEETGEEDLFSESRVQQILGDFARSTRSRSRLMLAMRESFDGTKRPVIDDALFLSLSGWQGIVFNEDDLEGSFILGYESALATTLDWTGVEKSDEKIEESATSQRASLTRFVFAYSPQLKRLRHRNGRPRLPETLKPLGYLHFSEEIRPEAEQTTHAFLESDIALKILSSDRTAKVLEAAVAVGLSGPEGSPPDALSGPEVAELPADAYADTVSQTEVFGRLTPEQKGEIIRSLKQQGALVAMVGDSVSDLHAQQEASLSIAFRDSNQAALSIADVILLDNTLNALPDVLETGQRIFNRLLDALKLSLTHATTAVVLTLVALFTGARYFPYLPAHNAVITIMTITLPAIGLAYWLGPGEVQSKQLARKLAFFILPAGITIAILVLGAHIFVQQWTGSIAYSRIIATHLLVGTGLLLVMFAQPPTEFWVGGDTLSGDRRPAMLAIALWFLFLFLTIVPFTSRLFDLSTLRPTEHYLFVLTLLAIWVLILRGLWRSAWLRQLAGIVDTAERI
ncbi:MAG: HAD-IC family P-type ATPase [Candidatus Promineifilaceae bacterium]